MSRRFWYFLFFAFASFVFTSIVQFENPPSPASRVRAPPGAPPSQYSFLRASWVSDVHALPFSLKCADSGGGRGPSAPLHTQISRTALLRAWRGKHLMLIGDSVTQYQYLNLAYYLFSAQWLSPHPPNENEHMHADKADFFTATHSRLRGKERIEFTVPEARVVGNTRIFTTPKHLRYKQTKECRYYYDAEADVRLTFILQYGMQHPAYNEHIGTDVWVAAACQHQPNFLILNQGWWGTVTPEQLQEAKVKIASCTQGKTRVIWRRTTQSGESTVTKPILTPDFMDRTEALDMDPIFDSLRTLTTNNNIYRDGIHFQPYVNVGMNLVMLAYVGLLSFSCPKYDWFQNITARPFRLQLANGSQLCGESPHVVSIHRRSLLRAWKGRHVVFLGDTTLMHAVYLSTAYFLATGHSQIASFFGRSPQSYIQYRAEEALQHTQRLLRHEEVPAQGISHRRYYDRNAGIKATYRLQNGCDPDAMQKYRGTDVWVDAACGHGVDIIVLNQGRHQSYDSEEGVRRILDAARRIAACTGNHTRVVWLTTLEDNFNAPDRIIVEKLRGSSLVQVVDTALMYSTAHSHEKHIHSESSIFAPHVVAAVRDFLMLEIFGDGVLEGCDRLLPTSRGKSVFSSASFPRSQQECEF